ncbi:DNA recombination protein RmuC [Oecophyllibacter saccharovorans]|uniref:DNA recombination protein RmuC n=1 Tax=Oecophyllibacter saccharovorans TaxID=2558360 RepID=UPI00116D9FB2|nr:DNA recombination protein RmuC [Oecophyllibacter saccharovorans]TPW35021.1 DNA recombination protein RmuC [Oecophyllibacter saccharovorans]
MQEMLPWLVTGFSLFLALGAFWWGLVRRARSDQEPAVMFEALRRDLEGVRHQVVTQELDSERALGSRLEQGRLENRQMFETLVQKARQDQSDLRLLLSEGLREMGTLQQEQMAQLQASVNQRLQEAVERQMESSFQRVVEQFAALQKAVGEVQGMTAQIGDLRKLFSNVKTRGGWGEAQCQAILDDILPAGSYERDFRLSPESGEVVEFALRMPVRGTARAPVLAIDSKFPTEAYECLLNAVETGEAEEEKAARKALENVVRLEARKIADKYIRPPITVEFAVLYVPTDGLYAEIAHIPGLIDEVGRTRRVLVLGPSLLPGLLRSVHLGYVTMALEERTEMIAGLLGETRQEMLRMDQVLEKLQRNAGTIGNTIEEARRRTRVLGRKLNALEEVGSADAGETDFQNDETAVGSQRLSSGS